MRVSDDRYTRDQRRLDLAWRLLHHEARTYTIRQWTGLSDDRIRKLYRNYVGTEGARHVLRHRGKSPRQAGYFLRNADMHFHAAQLASLFIIHGLLCGTMIGLEPRYRLGSLESGALLCVAYEAYLQLHVPARISFEHAWLLLLALGKQDELGVVRCEACGGVRLCDLLARRRIACPTCMPFAPPAAAAPMAPVLLLPAAAPLLSKAAIGGAGPC
jgi:hypothetical protein